MIKELATLRRAKAGRCSSWDQTGRNGLGHGIVNSYQSLLFTVSTQHNNRFNKGCALNSYVRMPFAERP